jgi:hypothetical protein
MIPASLCVKCKGRLWCQLPSCPIIEKFDVRQKSLVQIKDRKFEGSSPPGVFVSWTGYPDVSIAPVSPPVVSDANAHLDNPEEWFGKSSREIVEMRSSLISSKRRAKVHDAAHPARDLSAIQELALSVTPVEAEFSLKSAPHQFLSFHESTAPTGPSAELERMRLQENPRIPKKADYLSSDTAVKSNTAVRELYEDGLPVHYLYKILSAGTLGVEKNRKLVPTRWSITAIDDNVSKYLVDESVKSNQQIGEFELYRESYLGNHFFVLLVPSVWSFEMLECWLPGASWALFADKSEVNVISDSEGYEGRTKYADNITGAYYSARLAVAEHLVRKKRQATALVFREITDEYTVPLGVWVIRETMRKALQKKPLGFSELKLALEYIGYHLRVPLDKYLGASTLLSQLKHQKRISEWF